MIEAADDCETLREAARKAKGYLEKREILPRVGGLIRRLRHMRGCVNGELGRELMGLEQDLDILEAELAAAIDDYMAGQVFRHCYVRPDAPTWGGTHHPARAS